MIRYRIIYLLPFVVLISVVSFAQDLFPSTQLTFDPVQEGFPSWAPDGSFVIFQRFAWDDPLGRNGIWKIVPGDTNATQIYSGIAEHPRLSPDGRLIVFDADTGASIMMIDSKGDIPKKFLPDSVRIRSGGLSCWSPTGRQVVFKNADGALCMFDLDAETVTVLFKGEGRVALPGCWTPDGTEFLFSLFERSTRKSEMLAISPDGKQKRVVTGHREGFYRYLALSPDGSMLAYGALDGRYVGLWVMPAGGGTSIPLAITDRGHNESPTWSPDGKRIAFTSTRSGSFDIWLMEIDTLMLRKKLRDGDR